MTLDPVPLTGNDTVAMNLLRATVTGRHIVGDTVTFLARAWGNRWDSVGPFSGVSRMGSGVVNGRLYLFNGAMGVFDRACEKAPGQDGAKPAVAPKKSESPAVPQLFDTTVSALKPF